ncbi:hypothetical protein MKK63_03425 [Methylobacterium sp. J-088]|uniref:hypothetical protein n=1 Tax=Methylobacterium sp. J-088 TaxID=2836664 RepID=UPI001FB9D022|nr:hypothetical protein [Methylobacterium sp. J-088]MCJ2061756.1 hypothetical protein [Methylobacterium sp. J-088]
MPALKLSNPFRRTDATPSLKRRAAALKSDLLNLTAQPAMQTPLIAPGSDEAIAAWDRARSEFDRLTNLSEAEYAALRIGDSLTLWTTEWVKAAQRGDFSRFTVREMPAARAKTAAELADLLVITARRDLQFAEAQRRTSVRELYALAYPDGEDPEPELEPDPIHAAVAESYRAEAEMKAFGEDPASTSRPRWFLRERALTEAQTEARNTVWRTTPTTQAGRLALIDYARFQVALFTGSSVQDPDCPAYLFREIMGAVTAAFEADCAVANGSATHDLSGCDHPQLARLYETWESVFHHLTGASEIPCFTADRYSGHTPAGEVLDREYERASALLNGIAAEIRGRTATTADERNERLGVLIRHELNTNGRPVDAALLDELNAQHKR